MNKNKFTYFINVFLFANNNCRYDHKGADGKGISPRRPYSNKAITIIFYY